MRALLALALAVLLPQSAAAEDWRYCLAPSHADHKLYVSMPFAATMSMDAAESQFGRALFKMGLHYDDVQCPQSDSETGAVAMQKHAISINHELGMQVINMPWKPGS
jgi:ABC-type sugar transport system substrate-binding protein